MSREEPLLAWNVSRRRGGLDSTTHLGRPKSTARPGNSALAGAERRVPCSSVGERVREQTGRVSLLIMAGGRATRLGGVRKTMVHVGGRPILARIVEQLGPLADEHLALVHDADVPAPEGVRLLVDTHAFQGPLPALAHALAVATGDVCIVVAGDMPFVSNARADASASAVNCSRLSRAAP